MSFWAYIAIQLVAALIEYELTPTPPGAKPQIAQKPTVQQGTPRRIIFGDRWVGDAQVCYWGNQRQTPIKSGGK